MSILYIGSFPPPYGGVTIKNEYILQALLERTNERIDRIDTQALKRNPALIVPACCKWLSHKNKTLIVATAGIQRRRITMFLNRFQPSTLGASILMVMGGKFAQTIENDALYCSALRKYRKIYVETQGMAAKLRALCISNTAIFPNCRKCPKGIQEIRFNENRQLQCVFFSRVTPDKGVDIVFEAAQRLKDVTFHLYGELADEYSETFQCLLKNSSNVQYHGVFVGRNEEVYEELQKYDVMLFPSRWAFEGVPGILVETKIAGIPAIVSDICYNAEIVEDGVSGIVLKENTGEALAKAVHALDEDRELLYSMKCGARASAEAYYIENYVDEIINTLEVST